MIDIQHDSPVPIHEQIAGQIMLHAATHALPAGMELPDALTFAQQLVTNPQTVARAYQDLEMAGVLMKKSSGGMGVTSQAELICRTRLQERARQALYRAVAQARSNGLSDEEVRKAVEEQLAAPPAQPVFTDPFPTAIKKSTHATRHRDSQAIQVLPRQAGGRSP